MKENLALTVGAGDRGSEHTAATVRAITPAALALLAERFVSILATAAK